VLQNNAARTCSKFFCISFIWYAALVCWLLIAETFFVKLSMVLCAIRHEKLAISNQIYFRYHLSFAAISDALLFISESKFSFCTCDSRQPPTSQHERKQPHLQLQQLRRILALFHG
jgi:hypothetical protein